MCTSECERDRVCVYYCIARHKHFYKCGNVLAVFGWWEDVYILCFYRICFEGLEIGFIFTMEKEKIESKKKNFVYLQQKNYLYIISYVKQICGTGGCKQKWLSKNFCAFPFLSYVYPILYSWLSLLEILQWKMWYLVIENDYKYNK